MRNLFDDIASLEAPEDISMLIAEDTINTNTLVNDTLTEQLEAQSNIIKEMSESLKTLQAQLIEMRANSSQEGDNNNDN